MLDLALFVPVEKLAPRREVGAYVRYLKTSPLVKILVRNFSPLA
jgi:hypothetical protein